MPDKWNVINPFGPVGPPKLPEGLYLTKKQKEEADRKAREEQKKWSPSKKLLSGILSGFGGGLTAEESLRLKQQEGLASPERIGSAIGELTGFGSIPFTKDILHHGTRAIKEVLMRGFDPSRYNISDILGWMTHFAERPNYAETFIRGHSGGGIIPVKLRPPTEKSIALNTYKASTEDLARLYSVSTPEQKEKIKNIWRYAYRTAAWNKRKTVLPEEYDIKRIVDKFSPEQFKRTGFDAIRYSDIGEPAWAIPHPSLAVGAYTGKPIGDPNIPLKNIDDIVNEFSTKPKTFSKLEDRPPSASREKSELPELSWETEQAADKLVKNYFVEPKAEPINYLKLTKNAKLPNTGKYIIWDPITKSSSNFSSFDDLDDAVKYLNEFVNVGLTDPKLHYVVRERR